MIVDHDSGKEVDGKSVSDKQNLKEMVLENSGEMVEGQDAEKSPKDMAQKNSGLGADDKNDQLSNVS